MTSSQAPPLMPRQPPALPLGDADRKLECDLLRLLANLEFARATIEDALGRADTFERLQAMESLVNCTINDAEERLLQPQHPDQLTEALSEAGEFFTAQKQLKEKLRRKTSWTSWLTRRASNTNSSDTPDEETLFRQVKKSLVGTLERFMILWRDEFQCSQAAQSWNETYQVFLADLKRVVDPFVLS